METNVMKKVEAWKEDQATIDHLLSRGFVHVTGLEAVNNINYTTNTIKSTKKKGVYDQNNGMCVAVTPNGFVFLRASPHLHDCRDVETQLEKGATVPCSNGEEIPFNALMKRIADPLNEDFGDPFNGIL